MIVKYKGQVKDIEKICMCVLIRFPINKIILSAARCLGVVRPCSWHSKGSKIFGTSIQLGKDETLESLGLKEADPRSTISAYLLYPENSRNNMS